MTRIDLARASDQVFSGARVHNSAVQAIATATWTSITFDTERFDTDAFHSTATNTSRLTIPTTGYYFIGADLSLAANATGTARFCRFFLNGTTRIGGEQGAGYTPVAGNVIRFNPSTIYSLTATNYVEVQLFQDSGGNLNSEVTANSTPEFYIHRIG